MRERIGASADTVQSAEARGRIYEDLLGFVPPRIEARFAVTRALDPVMLDLQERMREYGMYPRHFDVKTAQLMLFGMLLMNGSDAAGLHAIAARRAGASCKTPSTCASCSADCPRPTGVPRFLRASPNASSPSRAPEPPRSERSICSKFLSRVPRRR